MIQQLFVIPLIFSTNLYKTPEDIFFYCHRRAQKSMIFGIPKALLLWTYTKVHLWSFP